MGQYVCASVFVCVRTPHAELAPAVYCQDSRLERLCNDYTICKKKEEDRSRNKLDPDELCHRLYVQCAASNI